MTRMSSLFPSPLAVLLAAGSLLAPGAVGGAEPPDQQFEAQRRQAQLKNPEDVSFTLRLKDGKTQFRQGETLRIELAFSSATPKAYQLDAALYDRSGRMDLDRFHVDPKGGVVDPLRDYFQGLFPMIGGGLRQMPLLEQKPFSVTLDLNEWLRFDRPGKYRMYVSTSRVADVRTRADTGSTAVPLTSNVVEFEIVRPEPGWAVKQVEDAVRLLDGGAQDESRRGAARVLRFLGTEEAVRQIVRRFTDKDSERYHEYMFGLIGSPHRELVVKEMEGQLRVPEFPVSTGFIRTLAMLVLFTRHPEPLPPYPSGDEEKTKLWQAEAEKRRKELETIHRGYLERLSALLAEKRGPARAMSLQTLLEETDNEAVVKESPELAAWAKRLPGEIAAVFHELPMEAQERLLVYRWRLIAGPAMLPIVRRIYEHPPTAQEYNQESLRTAALKRLYELDPVEGRRLILEQVRSADPSVRIGILVRLPDRSLPELDAVLVRNLEAAVSEKSARLVERYASPAALPGVKAVYERHEGQWACALQAALLAYFLRVDAQYGAQKVKQALSVRGPDQTGCYREVLSEVAGLRMTPELERIAVEYLDDRDPDVAADAARTLGRHGSAAAEQPLWKRLEKWHSEWKGREKELQNDPVGSNPNEAHARLEMALAEAISHGSGWLFTQERLKRLQGLLVTKNARSEVGSWVYKEQAPIQLFYSAAEETWDLEQYRSRSLAVLKSKLAQYPRGTRVHWPPPGSFDSPAEEKRLRADLQAFVEKQGLVLQE
jgi:hypothetical protein